MLRNVIGKAFFICILLLLLSSSVFANEIVGAFIVIIFPLFTMFLSYGIALIFIILIEGLMLKRILTITYFAAFKISTIANLFSTVIGVGIGIAAAIPLTFIIGWLIFASFFRKWLNYIIEKTGYFKNKKFGLNLCCYIIGFLTMAVSISLFEDRIDRWDLFSRWIDLKTTLLLIILFVFGFIISVVSESYVAVRLWYGHRLVLSRPHCFRWFTEHQQADAGGWLDDASIKEKDLKIVPTIFTTNIISYLALLIFMIIRAHY